MGNSETISNQDKEFICKCYKLLNAHDEDTLNVVFEVIKKYWEVINKDDYLFNKLYKAYQKVIDNHDFTDKNTISIHLKFLYSLIHNKELPPGHIWVERSVLVSLINRLLNFRKKDENSSTGMQGIND